MQQENTVQDDGYTLATGEQGAYRLQIVNSVHGQNTKQLLLGVGLSAGRRVADIGCGIGTITCWMAKQVGVSGVVFGVDVNADQLQQARLQAETTGLSNITFVEASAYETGLPSDSFDLVYCRFVLMHLTHPAEALQEMRRLVKPGGLLVCEEGDFTSPFCQPPSSAFERCFELYRAIGRLRHQHFCIGSTLYQMFLNAGFTKPEVSLAQPAFVRGDAKRLPEMTLREVAATLIAAGLTTQQEIERIAAEMESLAVDQTTLFGMVRMTQVWAQK